MKRKGIKIKKYSPFQDTRGQRRHKLLRNIAILLGLAVLFALGWMLARSGLGGGSDLPQVIIPSSVSIPQVSLPQTQASNDTQQPVADIYGNWAAVTHNQLSQTNLEDTIASLQQADISYAVITLKDSTGYLYYNSSEAAAAGSIVDAGFDAATVAQALNAAGIQPVASISAYQDSLAPRVQRDIAIQLAGSAGYLWLNNSQANGGVPWLNPYASGAQQYISNVISEVMALGYQTVMVQGLQFPSGYSLDMADLSANGTVIGEAQQLAATAQAWQAQVAQAGGSCFFAYDASTLLGNQVQLTGESPLGFGITNMVAQNATGEQAQQILQLTAQQTALQVMVLPAAAINEVGSGMYGEIAVCEWVE